MEKHMNRPLLLTLLLFTALISTSIRSQVIEPGPKLVVNNFQSDPANLDSRLIITDVDGIGPNIKVSIHHEDGRLVYERFETLTPFGKLQFQPAQYVNAYQHMLNQNPEFNGTLKIETDGGNIAAQFIVMSKSGAKNEKFTMAPAVSAEGTDNLLCQNFVSDKAINSQIIITNVESIRPVNVNIKYFSDEGGLIASDKLMIQPNGQVRIDPVRGTKGLKVSGTAYITVVGAGRVTGEYWQSSQSGNMRMSIPLLPISKVR